MSRRNRERCFSSEEAGRVCGYRMHLLRRRGIAVVYTRHIESKAFTAGSSQAQLSKDTLGLELPPLYDKDIYSCTFANLLEDHRTIESDGLSTAN